MMMTHRKRTTEGRRRKKKLRKKLNQHLIASQFSHRRMAFCRSIFVSRYTLASYNLWTSIFPSLLRPSATSTQSLLHANRVSRYHFWMCASNVHILHISINHLALSPAISTYKRVNIKIVNISSALHIEVWNSSSRENEGKIVSEKCRQQRLGAWQVIASHECVVDARRHASLQRYWQDDKNCVRNNVIYFKVRENFSSPCRRRRKKTAKLTKECEWSLLLRCEKCSM